MKKYIFLLLALFIGTTIQAQNYKVIVNKSNTVSSLTKKEASDFFLKKKTKWADGQKVSVVDQKGSSESRKVFTDEVHKKSVGAVKSYWQQAVFAGKGTPPVEKKTDAEVIEFVKANKGAMGYVSGDADVSGVKVLTVN